MEMQGLMDMGGGVGIFGTLLIGGLAGWIAEKLTRSDHGLLTNIVVGILGSFVGSVVANAIGLRMDEIFQGWFWGNLILSVAGAVLLIAVYRAFRRKS
jgi:uncharacterized membrane protein YeaQ/YmgE (transglycosylase-associated protein family)